MSKKLFALMSIALLAVLASTGVASAQDAYPPGGDTVVASDTTVEPGQSITLSAQVYAPGADVTFTMFSTPVVLGTATANSRGVATLTTTIPANTSPGTHRIEATGLGADGQPLTVVLSVTVAGAAGGTNIPTTGSSSTLPMTQVALAAIAGGGLLVLLASRRRSTTADDRETAGV